MRICWIALFSVLLLTAGVRAQGDETDEDVVVEEDGNEAAGQPASEGETQEEAEDEGESLVTSSPDVELRYSVLQPAQSSADVQLKANSRARFLVGFSNQGQKSFLVQAVDSSFRYSHDYNYIIVNHTARRFDRIVPGGHDATFDYSFYVHEFFAGRPFYLTVVVYYRGEDASLQFRSAVFNTTVKVEEEESGFDAETFFMYLAFAAILALLAVLVWQAIRSAGRRVAPKTGLRGAPNGVEVGTEAHRKDGDVDYQWITPHVLQHMKQSKKGGAGSSSGSGSDSEGNASAGSNKRVTRRGAAAASRKSGGSDNE